MVGGINRVQVGCGPKHLRPDWWNTDVHAFPGVDEAMDATGEWPWRDCLDFVFGEHFLEHLPIDRAVAFLVNAGNALRPGGRIRLTTPSLEWVLRTHFDLQETVRDKILSATFGMNRAFHGWGHKFLFTKPMLHWILEDVGYQEIIFCDYGKSPTKDLENLELHGGWSIVDEFPSVWIVEASRPNRILAASDNLLARIEVDFCRYVRSGR